MPRPLDYTTCANPHCEADEGRIDNYCSVYCRDIDELSEIIDGLTLENADYHDANELYGKRITQLEAELAGMELMNAEADAFLSGMEIVPEGTLKENEALQGREARMKAERSLLTIELGREAGEPVEEIAERITREGLIFTDALLTGGDDE